jgi:hypothetical protein
MYRLVFELFRLRWPYLFSFGEVDGLDGWMKQDIPTSTNDGKAGWIWIG